MQACCGRLAHTPVCVAVDAVLHEVARHLPAVAFVSSNLSAISLLGLSVAQGNTLRARCISAAGVLRAQAIEIRSVCSDGRNMSLAFDRSIGIPSRHKIPRWGAIDMHELTS
jgi:hypothetical protein